MSKVINDLLAEVTLSTTGGNGGRRLYTVVIDTSNTYYLLARTTKQAEDMADAILAATGGTAITTAVALASVYEMTGIANN